MKVGWVNFRICIRRVFFTRQFMCSSLECTLYMLKLIFKTACIKLCCIIYVKRIPNRLLTYSWTRLYVLNLWFISLKRLFLAANVKFDLTVDLQNSKKNVHLIKDNALTYLFYWLKMCFACIFAQFRNTLHYLCQKSQTIYFGYTLFMFFVNCDKKYIKLLCETNISDQQNKKILNVL